MESAAVLYILTAILAVCAASLFVSLFLHRSSQLQLRSVQEQLEIGRESRRSQNMLHTLGMLRDQDFRSAVMVVRNRMKGKPVEEWEAGDVFHVLLVCSTYNMVGLLVKHDLVPQQLFLEHWGGSVIETYEALSEFIEKRQVKSPLFCADFQWLYVHCRQTRYSEAPSREMPRPKQGTGPRRMGAGS